MNDIEQEKAEKFELTIERISNGYILTTNDNTATIQDKESEVDTSCELLWEIADYFGLVGSKHDEERIDIRVTKRGIDY